MLEKLLDLLKIILEKYLIPALIAIILTILSINLFTKNIEFLSNLSKPENYILQGLFYFLIILAIYSILLMLIQKHQNKHKWDDWDKSFREDLINEIDAYPSQIREIIKQLFNSQNTPMEIRTNYNGALELQNILREKVIFSKKNESNSEIIYLCRFTDRFYDNLLKLYKEKGCICHY